METSPNSNILSYILVQIISLLHPSHPSLSGVWLLRWTYHLNEHMHGCRRGKNCKNGGELLYKNKIS